MKERNKDQHADRPRLKALLCKRTGEQVGLEEHKRCSYCFGRMSEIEEGKHEAFCDYQVGVDPINFGFDPRSPRHRSG